MKRTWKALAGAVIAAGLVAAPFVGMTAANAEGPADNTNNTEYWEGLYTEHQADCYKDSHGSITNDGDAVTLPAFNQDWPGDHWEVLIVKGGSVDNGDGPGNKVYNHPEAGVPYFAPLNDGGQQADVSHWIVCKGTTPEQEPDPEAVPAQPTAQAGIETCVDGQSVDANGTITLPAFEGGHWAEAEAGTLTNIVPGEYGFTPVIDEGYTYDGPEMLFVTVPASVDVTCDVPEVPPTNITCETFSEGPLGTNLNGVWQDVDTRSAGHYEYVDGGLHVWTDDATSNAKVSLGTSATFALKNTGQIGIEWTGTTPPPGVNLYVDFDNNGSVDGTLVFETVYGQDLWLTNGSAQFVKDNAPVVGGGNGSQWHGTIDQWLTKFADANVQGIAFSLGSGVLGDGVIESITVGCAVYAFDFEREVPPQPEDKVVVSEWSTPEYTCENEPLDQVPTTRTITTTPYVWDAESWTWVEGESTVVTEEASYVVTSADLESLECPTTPTPTPSTPAAKPTPAALAVTGGGDSGALLPLAGVLASVLGGVLVTLAVIRRRRQA
jgi:hypothetical protein